MRLQAMLLGMAMAGCLLPVSDDAGLLPERPDAAVVVDAGVASSDDAGPVDGGATDAGVPDAGWPDAGTAVDGGETGSPDSGLPDAGQADAGTSRFDAGACTTIPLVPLSEFANSPRADWWLELLVLHGDPTRFSLDDATYARAVRERALIDTADAGPFRFVPSWGEGLALQFDAVGIAQLRAGNYTDWDCLNWTYRARPQLYPGEPSDLGRVFVEVDPVVALPQLEAEYRALPHVVDAWQNSFGVFATCGFGSDSCLMLDGGSWSWLWYTESNTCVHEWHRLLTEADGGVQFETWRDAGIPFGWIDEAPLCWDQLRATQGRPRDGGP